MSGEQPLCRVDDLPPDSCRRFEVGKVAVCLVRIGDEFYAIGDKCSHADFSLCDGELYPEEREIECWKHGSTFSLVTGEPQSLPATKPVPVFPVKVVDGDVVVTVK
ncbi:MAG: Rieske (2Fe-2S) domain protein [Acidimicrobiales bacterium]|nr:Rieske (2Fe-2S) domain protein [Acidimicrobiales bacterium]